MAGKTLYDKIWDAHLVSTEPNGESVLYVDLHLIHEVTSPQAFAGLKAAHRGVRRPDRTLAVADHNVPTEGQALGVDDGDSGRRGSRRRRARGRSGRLGRDGRRDTSRQDRKRNAFHEYSLGLLSEKRARY